MTYDYIRHLIGSMGKGATMLKGSKLTSYGARFPLVKATGNSVKDMKAKNARTASQNIVNILIACPEIAQDAQSNVIAIYELFQDEREHGEDAVETGTLDAYDKDWCGLFVGEKLGVEPETVGKALVLDPKFGQKTMRWLLYSSGQLKVGEACADRSVMERACRLRMLACGNRAALSVAPIRLLHHTSGDFDWGAGAYKVEANGKGIVNKIVHRPTGDGAEVSEKLCIKKSEWELKGNHDDMSTELYLDETVSHKCKKFFKKGFGPFKVPQLKGHSTVWDGYVNSAKRVVDEEKKKRSIDKQSKADLHAPVAEAKSEGSKKARNALAGRQALREARCRAKC